MSDCEEIERINRINRKIFKWTEWENSEKYALCLLKELGYDYIHGKELAPEAPRKERESMRGVVLKKRLISKIRQFNPWINDANIQQIIRKLTIPTKSTLESNEELWGYLTKPHTLTVEQDIEDGQGRRNRGVTLIDWNDPESNEFLCSNQFKVNSSKGNRIPDIVLFVNGLPLVVIECKSPLITNPLTQAIHQVSKYQEIIPRLFHLNQIVIITAGQAARYGVVGNKYEHYREWKDPFPITVDELSKIIEKTGRKTTTPTPQDILICGLLEPKNLLDIIRNFIVYETIRGKLVKKIARYQQFRAVIKTIAKIYSGKERGGTVWHTQGSGKSLTMLFTAVKLRREEKLKNPLIVFISDRIDLVDQLNGTFNACGFDNVQIPKKAKNLLSMIKTGQGVTVFSTIQKFRLSESEEDDNITAEFPVLNEDKNIFVLVDEAHRSQYKTFALRMRKSMPYAFYIAYTGTPLARTEKNEKITVGKGKTVNKFGGFIDVYDIRQSVEDGATIQIYYENRLPELQIEGNSIDAIFDRVFADKTDEEREAIKNKYATKKFILAADERIKKVALDIIEHFETHIRPNGFKAQIVVNSRELAVKYKKFLDQYNAPESAVIISANPNYDNELKKEGVKFITDKAEQKKYHGIDGRFHKPDDPLTFLIVCDMLITGFDAPIEQVIYLDKSLREHNLLQAIARVNRTNENKTHGLIVDYYGISSNLEEALDIFDINDIEGVMIPIDSELPRLAQFHRNVMKYLNGLDRADLEGIVLKLEPEDVRASFYADFKKFAQSLDMVLPNPKAEPYLDDLKLLQNIIKALRVRTRDEHLNIVGCGGKIKQIINDHVRSLGITQLVEPVPILSDKFQETLDALKNPKSKASEIEHAVRQEISVKVEEDPVFYTSLKEKLEEIIEMYRQQRIDLAEQIKQLKVLVTELKSRPDKAKLMGLNQSEMAFFNLFKADLNVLGIKEDSEIVRITYEVLEAIEELITLVDWQRKNDILRQIRRNSKIVLSRYGIKRQRWNTLSQEIVNLAKTHYSR